MAAIAWQRSEAEDREMEGGEKGGYGRRGNGGWLQKGWTVAAVSETEMRLLPRTSLAGYMPIHNNAIICTCDEDDRLPNT